jgi:hypothetical protein
MFSSKLSLLVVVAWACLFCLAAVPATSAKGVNQEDLELTAMTHDPEVGSQLDLSIWASVLHSVGFRAAAESFYCFHLNASS